MFPSWAYEAIAEIYPGQIHFPRPEFAQRNPISPVVVFSTYAFICFRAFLFFNTRNVVPGGCATTRSDPTGRPSGKS